MNKENLEKIIELRHELHKNPELSLHETNTIKTIRAFLTGNTSLSVEERDGWLFAVKKGNAPSSGGIAFRADLDALPIDETGSGLPYESASKGISHKCGHDGHAAALCGLALELDNTETEKSVYLIFQGAEEIGEGAKKIVPFLKKKDIREIYAFHNLPGYPEGELVYRRELSQPASEGLSIGFQGKPSHASAPEEGANPAALIAGTVLQIQKLLDRPHEGMVQGTVVGMEAGSGDFGISPGEGTLMLTLRAENEQEMKMLEEEILAYVQEGADAANIRIGFQRSDYFPETRNHERAIEKVLAAADRLSLPHHEMESLWRASEDFGYYLKECEGAIVYIGAGEEWPALHTAGYDYNDNIPETAVDLFLALAD